jgi:hypothetical protein
MCWQNHVRGEKLVIADQLPTGENGQKNFVSESVCLEDQETISTTPQPLP